MNACRLGVACLLLCWLAGCDDNNNSNRSRETVSFEQETLRIASNAQPANTPGTAGVVVDNPLLLEQFGPDGPDLNQALYTRYFLSDAEELKPDAILVLMPGFEGGSSNFAPLARWTPRPVTVLLSAMSLALSR
jgi:hypothetical protein